MKHLFLHFGPFRLLLAEPKFAAYGHLVQEIVTFLAMAKAAGVPVYFLRPRVVVNEAMYCIESDEVSILPRTWWRTFLLGVAWFIASLPRLDRAIAEAFHQELREMSRDKGYSEKMRARLKRLDHLASGYASARKRSAGA